MAKNSKAGLANFLVALLALTGLVSISAPASAATVTCTVTTNADSGSGSLRECYEGSSLNVSDMLLINFSEDFLIELDSDLIRDFPDFAEVSIVGPTRITASDSFSGDYLLWSQSYGSTLTIENMSFLDAPGTAVNVYGDLEVIDSLFEGNGSIGVDGGAVRAGSRVDVRSSTFLENQGLDGGAMSGTDAFFYVETSHFEGNTAQEDGGAIHTLNELVVVRSSFVTNASGGNGGALYGSAEDSNDETHIFHSTFYDNEAENGGALYQQDEDAFVIFSTFVDNSADFDGSAVYTDGEDINIFGSIVANSVDSESSSQLWSAEESYEWGGNIFTGSPDLDPIDAEFIDIFDAQIPETTLTSVDYEQLDLGELTLLANGTYAFRPSPASTAGDRVELDIVSDIMAWIDEFDSARSDLFDDMLVDGQLSDQSGALVRGPLSAGSIDFVASVYYSGPVVTNDPETAQSGSTVTYTGSDLDEVISATIAGQSAAIVSKTESALTLRVPAGLSQGMHDVVLSYGSTEQITLQNGLIIQDSMKAWTKLQADNTVKMYAKNIIGEGKIQFFHNGNEIAWIRAANSLNPKLSSANGSHYLVRTRELVEGKNAFEIHDDGVRVWRAAYSK